MWKARVFTLYPEIFPGPLKRGLYGKALEKKIWNLDLVNIRDSANDKHKTVDDTPFGGGSGMLIKPDVVAKSLDKNIFNQQVEEYKIEENKMSFIDSSIYKDEVIEILKQKSQNDNLNFITIPEYYEYAIKDEKHSINKIAVLYASGDIVGGEAKDKIGSEQYSKIIREIRNNEKIYY